MSTATIEKNKKAKSNKDTKDELLLDSLEIKGYRCFEHLTIEKLGRVNLIVGKNNVGKTALLEALWIYANSARTVIEDILAERDENKATRFYKNSSNEPPKYRHLFFDRSFANKSLPEIKFSIGEKENEEKYVSYLSHYKSGDGALHFASKSHKTKINNEFIEVKRLEKSDINVLWDEIANTQKKKKVFEALKILDKNIIEVNVQPFEFTDHNLNTVVLAQIENQKEAFPLKSFGEGLNRLFETALTLVKCEDGILLIDEIEIGLHYSVLPDVWKLIFKTAKELNVQVFATTHSKDCIEAFAQAAYDSPEEGMLVRLERQGEKIVAKTIAEERLVDAVDYDVEVR